MINDNRPVTSALEGWGLGVGGGGGRESVYETNVRFQLRPLGGESLGCKAMRHTQRVAHAGQLEFSAEMGRLECWAAASQEIEGGKGRWNISSRWSEYCF